MKNNNAKALFIEYEKWCLTAWRSNSKTPNYNDKDIDIIGFGLAGEIGELIEEYQKDNSCQFSTEFKKELGDVIFYIIQCCNIFKLDFIEMYEKQHSKLFNENKYLDNDNIFKDLSLEALLSMEVFKKRIRDNKFNIKKLENHLHKIISLIFVLEQNSSLEWKEIIDINIKKVEKKNKKAKY